MMESTISGDLDQSEDLKSFPFKEELNSVSSIDTKNLAALHSLEKKINEMAFLNIEDPMKQVSHTITDLGKELEPDRFEDKLKNITVQHSSVLNFLATLERKRIDSEDRIQKLTDETNLLKQNAKSLREEYGTLESALKRARDQYVKTLGIKLDFNHVSETDYRLVIHHLASDKQITLGIKDKRIVERCANFSLTEKQTDILMDKSLKMGNLSTLMCLFRDGSHKTA